MSAKYAQFGREEETYAASYVCVSCKGAWYGAVTRDLSRTGVWPLRFNFCPVCGVRFEGEIPRAEASERHRLLRAQAEYKNRNLAMARRITYVVQSSAEFRTEWQVETHWRYGRETDPRSAAAMWRDRLAQGSWFGEGVRLVAQTPRGEKVVFGPVHLEPNTWREQ